MRLFLIPNLIHVSDLSFNKLRSIPDGLFNKLGTLQILWVNIQRTFPKFMINWIMLLAAISYWRRNIAICPPSFKLTLTDSTFYITVICFLGGCLIKNFDPMPQAKLWLIKKWYSYWYYYYYHHNHYYCCSNGTIVHNALFF